jgi:hypothetical protein
MAYAFNNWEDVVQKRHDSVELTSELIRGSTPSERQNALLFGFISSFEKKSTGGFSVTIGSDNVQVETKTNAQLEQVEFYAATIVQTLLPSATYDIKLRDPDIITMLESQSPRKMILEEEWCADDIVAWASQQGWDCKEIWKQDLMGMQTDMFLSQPFFCSTDVVQHHLKNARLECLIPDTYPPKLFHLFGRRIAKVAPDRIGEFPCFVKPTSNDKSFDGTVVKSKSELLELVGGSKIYVSEVVKFKVEYRLFIGNRKLYAHGFYQGDEKIPFDDVAASLSSRIIDVIGTKFCSVDIGYANGRWLIVEVNPPFSLDDAGIPIEIYMQYAIDFWEIMIRDRSQC